MSQQFPPNPQQQLQQIAQAVNELNGNTRALASWIARLRQRLAAIEAGAALQRAAKRPLLEPLEAASQYGEDVFLWDLFSGKHDGFFIEAGDFDGYNFSVTWLFEAVGWRGLLVEADPGRAAQCQERRKNSRVINAAISRRGSSGMIEFVQVADALGGMFSYVQDTQDMGGRLPDSVPRTRISVPVTTLNDLLAEHQGVIDFAIIDVEGGEPDAIDGFDLPHFRPRVLLIEDNSFGRNPALDSAMAQAPYQHLGWVQVNRVYVHREEKDLLLRAKALLTPW